MEVFIHIQNQDINGNFASFPELLMAIENMGEFDEMDYNEMVNDSYSATLSYIIKNRDTRFEDARYDMESIMFHMNDMEIKNVNVQLIVKF